MRKMLPHGLVMWGDYVSRFRALGRNRASAWRSAASHSLRTALVQSRIELLPNFLRSGNLSHVIDVGANHGQWLTAFLQFSRSRRVDVFEPNPAAFEVLSLVSGYKPNRFNWLAKSSESSWESGG
jgi:hypothetical protein